MRKLQGHDCPVTDVAYSGNGSIFVSIDQKSFVCIWETLSYEVLGRFALEQEGSDAMIHHRASPHCELTITPDARFLLAPGGKLPGVWEILDPANPIAIPIPEPDPEQGPQRPQANLGRQRVALPMASPDGQCVYALTRGLPDAYRWFRSGDPDEVALARRPRERHPALPNYFQTTQVESWSIPSWRVRIRTESWIEQSGWGTYHLSADGSSLIIIRGGTRGDLVQLDNSPGNDPALLIPIVTDLSQPLLDKPITAAVLLDGARRALLKADRQLVCLDLHQSGSTVGWEQRLPDEIRVMEMTPDGRRLVTGDAKGRLRLIDVADGRRGECIRLGGSPIRSLAVSPDGSTAAVTGEFQGIRLVDLDMMM